MKSRRRNSNGVKGVILAGGSGTRLMPLTKVTNKHLLPVYDRPMICFPIQTLKRAGIKDILIVSGRGHAGHFLELLGSGKELGVKLSYEVQEKAGGIAQALGLAEDFADSGKIIVILGDNVFQQNLKRAVNNFKKQKSGAKIFLSRVKNPQAYGIAQIVKNKIVGIEEKPKNPKNNLAVVGVYFYDNQVFKIIKTLKPSARGELEITDVNNYYVRNKSMRYEILRGWWGDCGESFNSLLQASQLVSKTKNL
jgi:glucose-1-phosphate thymidylyltransferase